MVPASESDPPPSSDAASIVALVSGGLDSCLMAWRAAAAGNHVYPLYVRQGTVWQDREESAARRFLEAAGKQPARESPRFRGHRGTIEPLTVLNLQFPPAYVARWAVDPAAPAPGADSPDEAVDLPGKNLALLTMAAIFALGVGAHRIAIGLLGSNPFPDASQTFLDYFATLFAQSTGHALQVERPLALISKPALLQEGRALPLELTFSCLRPQGEAHCGQCNKCAERQAAFAAAAVEDRTKYKG